MKLLPLLAGIAGVGAGILAYGAWTSDRLVAERRTLHLKSWPKTHRGFRIGLLADLHLRMDGESLRISQTACQWLNDQEPDVIVVAGDVISFWQKGVLDLVELGLAPLVGSRSEVIVIAGNHEYAGPGTANDLAPLLKTLGFSYLRNETWLLDEINFIGVDSGNSGQAMPYSAIAQADHQFPSIVLWHEPDYVKLLPSGLDLMLSGHSHGGQFVTPWGWAPMTSHGGSDYLSGFFPHAPCPLYVTRGLATTGPPSRFCCPPEAAVLTLEPSDRGEGWMEQVSSERLI